MLPMLYMIVASCGLKLDKFMSKLSNFGKICLLRSTGNIKFVSDLLKVLFHVARTQNKTKIGYALGGCTNKGAR
jgi:hypothetical protein